MTGSVLRRIAVVAAVVVGLIAMHHLVATGCALATGHHGAASIQASSVTGPPDVSTAHTGHPDERAQPVAGTYRVVGFDSLLDEDDVSEGTTSIIACVAVLVLLLILARSRSRSTALKDRAGLRFTVAPMADSQVSRPPDLRALSICRT